MIRQLAFDLPVRAALGRDSFFVSPANAVAVAALDGWRGWPGARMLLMGPAGSGKSHLAQVWAGDTGAVCIAGVPGLLGADLPALAATPLVIEDADGIAGDPAGETALFHLYNLMTAPLLLTATRPVRDWGLRLPDLISRLQSVAVTRLDPPDDALLAAILAKLFADRQIPVPPTLVPYLLARMDRSFAAARDLVAALDATALAAGKPVTRTLAATLLDSAAPGA